MPTPPSSTAGRKRSRAKPPEERKRPRYVAKACGMCKKRKTKCDGLLPCQLCFRHSFNCSYSEDAAAEFPVTARGSWDVHERSATHSLGALDSEHLITLISNLQSKVSSMEVQLSSQPAMTRAQYSPPRKISRDEGGFARPIINLKSSASLEPSPPPPVFCGPTSANYGFGIVQVMLQPEADSSRIVTKSNTELAGSIIANEREYPNAGTPIRLDSLAGVDVLQSLELEEALRLLNVYHAVVGHLHPILDVSKLRLQTKALWEKMERIDATVEYQLTIEEVECLKIVLAIAFLAEGGGYHDSAIKLHESIQPSLVEKLLGTKFNLQDQMLLILVGTYHLFHEDYRMASRIIALAVRLIMEAGLHRRQILMHRFPNHSERRQAIVVFYTTIVLDRQLCFAAGLPYILKDPDVDLPDFNGGPYLHAMSSYIRIGAQLWESLLDNRGKLKTAFREEDFDFMEYQIQRWQQALPEQLRPELVSASLQGSQLNNASDGIIFSARILLYLRANQIRILMQRPILFTTQTASTHQRRIGPLIDVARDNIEKLVQVDRTSDVYRKQQPFHNHFLASALSSLFLVVAHQSRNSAYKQHAEGPHSNAAVRDTIFKALDLIKSYSSTSRSCRRLLQSIDGPKGLLTRLGLLRRDEQTEPTQTPAPHIPFTPARTPGEPHGTNNPADLTTNDGVQSQFEAEPMADMSGIESSMADFLSGDVSLNAAFVPDPLSGQFGKEVNFLFDNFL